VSNRPFSEEQFQETFKTYFGPLCNYVNSHIKDWEGSREIVQNTFMKIWENRSNIEVTTTAKTYLYSAVKNRMIDYIRANKRRGEVEDDQTFDEAEQDSEIMDSMILRQEILKSLDKLKPKMKKIFSLCKIEGLTYGEAAAYLDVSKRTVEDNIAKALVLLRDDLKQNEYVYNY